MRVYARSRTPGRILPRVHYRSIGRTGSLVSGQKSLREREVHRFYSWALIARKLIVISPSNNLLLLSSPFFATRRGKLTCPRFSSNRDVGESKAIIHFSMYPFFPRYSNRTRSIIKISIFYYIENMENRYLFKNLAEINIKNSFNISISFNIQFSNYLVVTNQIKKYKINL